MQWFFRIEMDFVTDLLVFADLDIPAHRQAQTDGFQEPGDEGPEVVNPPLVGDLKKEDQDSRDQHRDRKRKDGGGKDVELLGHVVVDRPFVLRIVAGVAKDDHAGQKEQKERIDKAKNEKDRHQRLLVRVLRVEPYAVKSGVVPDVKNDFRSADGAGIERHKEEPQHKAEREDPEN